VSVGIHLNRGIFQIMSKV